MAAGKAAGALGLFCLVLLLDFISCQSLPRFGRIGEDITLSPSSTVNFTEIIWKKGMNKVIEWNGNTGVIRYPLFKERVHLDIESGDLVIFNLTSLDEDEYEIESVDLTNGLKFNLLVLDPLPSPTLHCNWTNESLSVHCEMPQSYSRHREQLRYAWRCSSQQCERSSQLAALVPYPLPVLNFTKDDDLSQEVQCFVENPESNRISSMLLSTCVPADNSRRRYALIASSFVGLVFIIGFLYCARRTERTTAR
ncbi:lymphocyte function-associated antigen 3 [Eptesicus fuscus]|uniref:lymphocyte function-associated antigen 3 n=1 Tax=Eptesicus fuscus TaxID=29078 RepID=UPI002403EB26|nr:lymphocyte function-associated antigen 3 [Eptesicus fuscus]